MCKACVVEHLGQLQVIDLKMALGNSPCKNRRVQWNSPRSSSGFWYVTGELDVWKVRWFKTPGCLGVIYIYIKAFTWRCNIFHFSRGSQNHGKLTDITDIHLIRYDLRRKKHVQIASNCVVLSLGTQIEGPWFYRWPEVTTQMVALHPLMYMGVSKNRGTPKWMLYNGIPYKNGWSGGTTIFGNTCIYIISEGHLRTS